MVQPVLSPNAEGRRVALSLVMLPVALVCGLGCGGKRGRSRHCGNETMAIGRLREYCAAQSLFRLNPWYPGKKGVYANPSDGIGFPDLYRIGGPDGKGEVLKLIRLEMALATGPATAPGGYYFVDITCDGKGPHDYTKNFGLCAAPAKYDVTGKRTFIVSYAFLKISTRRGLGTVWAQDNGGKAIVRWPDTVGERWAPVEE